MPLNELPAGLAEPLHMLGPESSIWDWLPWLVGLAGIAALFWLYKRSSRPSKPPTPPAPTQSPPDAAPGDWRTAISRARQEAEASGNYRKGCHALAEALRRALGTRNGVSFVHLTAREIAEALGDIPIASFFGLLADLQFRRPEPERDDFLSICDLADATAANSELLTPRA